MAYHLMPDGTLPMQNGVPVLITYNDFYACCCPGTSTGTIPIDCTNCPGSNNQGPAQWQVVIEDIQEAYWENTCPSEDCESTNGIYILDPTGNVCEWEKTIPDGKCCVTAVRLVVGDVAGIKKIRVSLMSATGAVATWEDIFPDDDCLSLEDYPLDESTPSVFEWMICALWDECDPGNATCEITSLP